MSKVLVEVKDLKKEFEVKKGFMAKKQSLKAVDGISFDIHEGETLSLVGESGCGKSTTGRLVLKLLPLTSGKVIFDGADITNFDDNKMRPLRKNMQMIFQDPYSSLNPRIKVKDLISEPLLVHTDMSKKDRYDKVRELLEIVGLDGDNMEKYAHEFSGGQRQRIGIARALSVNPKLIVADEPVSSLDVSIQSQVLNLMQDLQEEFGLTYLFISHNLSVVEHISNRVCVMYLGRLVEIATRDDLYAAPKHPYTKALLSAVPIPDPEVKQNRLILKGDIPSPVNPPSGCNFHTRCPDCMEICKREAPPVKDFGNGHKAACHLY
ncbi:ABC transporter ATP-binding protein [Anaeropeptidivorans aminofermentans]|jgi:peptide/nickel transport system ATP-binding protein/oligopeptide transport system ATP-binding protein|uniref:ABC transporter ATP-binding protein n=1 Tax=Anaeropeptidivorans aminofermentans TaxID=2934315 RepID=UPI002024AFEC|nr:dipeptide ABC transporter ATP-binding protein [Anaeropeptidivorans aminofermentans]MBE6011073.1 dipeptide ABC transporter ATP-binding protein [Lachnospiraceae bacterium]